MTLKQYNRLTMRKAGQYISRCRIPADMLNEGRFVVGYERQRFQGQTLFS